jgi:hypothetical protein
MSESASSVRSDMSKADWIEIADSEFVDYVEGRQSFGLVFEHDEIGLHGLKFDPATGVLRPVSFTRTDEKEGENE